MDHSHSEIPNDFKTAFMGDASSECLAGGYPFRWSGGITLQICNY